MTPKAPPADVMRNFAAHTEGLVRYRDEKRTLKREGNDILELRSEK
jgi:hypothetical protein